MKKRNVFLIIPLIVLLLSSCVSDETGDRGRLESGDEMTLLTDNDDILPAMTEEMEDDGNTEDVDMEAEESNRKLMAEVLEIDENDSSLKYTLASLRKIGAGKVESAVFGTNEDGDEYVDIVAEDGTNYRLYLAGGYSVMEIENLDTGEWPKKAYR